MKVKRAWRQAFMFAKAMVALKAKPPEQKTKQELHKLKDRANRVALRKLLYGWPTLIVAFRSPAEKVPWPVAPEVLPMPEKSATGIDVGYNKGPKGTVGMREFFALLIALKLSRAEMVYVVEVKMGLKGCVEVFGLPKVEKPTKASLRAKGKKKQKSEGEAEGEGSRANTPSETAAERLPPMKAMTEDGREPYQLATATDTGAAAAAAAAAAGDDDGASLTGSVAGSELSVEMTEAEKQDEVRWR